MITKEIIKIELHYDSSRECDLNKEVYEEHGFKILSYGSEDDWYFICQKIKEV